MHVILGIIYLGVSLVCWGVIFSIDERKSLRDKIMVQLLAIAASICLGLAFSQYIETDNRPKQYPVLEYHLSIKTTTIDNQTDTTYVITKIK